MHQQTENKTICPFCETPLPISSDITDEVIFCRKCGNKVQPGQKDKHKEYPVIGKLAVSYRYISEDQLKKALMIQQSNEKKGRKVTLAEIFIKYEMLTPNQMKVLHKAKDYLEQKKLDKKFADMVIRRNPALKSQVEKALGIQARVFKEKKVLRRLGDMLVLMKIITADERDAILAGQKHIEKKEHQEASPPVTLVISEDSMQADLSITRNPAEPLTLETVKEMLQEKEIAFGLADDETINHFLVRTDTPRKLTIAVGTPEIQGKDASIKLSFDENHLRAGAIDEEGNIDFKDRGDIPFVKAGDTLAEKIPLVDGADGIDIFGNAIITEKGKDIELGCGTGTAISEDGMSVIAETDGQPAISFDGSISVYKEITINGDVDYNTGHVTFDGNVIVKGIIRNGFNVTCAGLNATEISGGAVDAESDISVSGGIIDATIHARGNVYATYIKNSTITSCGNLVVKKEILDSGIILGGFCQVQNGSILSSSVSAKKGVQAANIGSDSSPPNKLKIGVDDLVQAETKRIDTRISELEKTLADMDTAIHEYTEKQNVIHGMISEMSHEKNRISGNRKTLDFTLQRFSKKKAKRNLAHAASRLQELDQKLQTIEETTESLFAEQEEFQQKKDDALQKKQQAENDILSLGMEKEGIIHWSRQEKSVPVLKVTGSIYDRTVVTGKKTRIVLKETYRNVHLRETKSALLDGPQDFEIQIVQNRK